MEAINHRIRDFKTLFDIEVQGKLHEYLGIQIDKQADGSIIMTQPHLIDSILRDLNLLQNNNTQAPTTTSQQLPSMPTQMESRSLTIGITDPS